MGEEIYEIFIPSEQQRSPFLFRHLCLLFPCSGTNPTAQGPCATSPALSQVPHIPTTQATAQAHSTGTLRYLTCSLSAPVRVSVAMSLDVWNVGPVAGGSVQQQRERWDRKRGRTSCELVRTEQKYCLSLELVVTYFVEILKAKGTLKQDIRESIFSSITSIHSVNQALLADLEGGRVGLGFERFCPNLNYYYTYVDNFQKASRVLQVQLKKNKAFRRFKKLQESRPEFRASKLEELLQLPLQRIQQYKHFLRDLAENTSPDHPEFQQLSRAVKAISGVAQRIQDNGRSQENLLQLQRVQKLLKGRKTKVLAPGRWYIREGWLKVVPTKGTEAKPKMFFLFSDILLLTTPCSSLHPTNGDKFACQRVYPLRECTVDKVFGHTRSQGGLISLTFARDKLLLMSGDQEDINDWYRSLTSSIGQLMSRNTVVHRRDDLCRKPLRSAQGDPNTPSAPPHTRKRVLVTAEPPGQRGDPAGVAPPAGSDPAGASKRMKLSGGAVESPQEAAGAGSGCVIL
ncbi:rho guanine nucleotide exchange factor 39 isoform X1 [Anguilla rostrata]|uniref:rho guanine nucleotide exchange factor 39 isoform X1 n=1 Tax=Anguilla rostrata TaxID=7938 RepID=UPI0030D073D8